MIWQEDLFAVGPTCDIILNVAELCVCVWVSSCCYVLLSVLCVDQDPTRYIQDPNVELFIVQSATQ